VRDARHRDDAALQQRRDRLRQQIIERGVMLDPEVAQRVVIHRDAAAQPPIRIVAVAESVDFARAADPIHRGVEPERDQDLRIDRRPAGASLAGADRRVERRQIQALDEPPHETSRVTGRQQRFQIARLQLNLIAMGRLVPRRRVVTPITGRMRINIGKEGIAHAPQGSTTMISEQAHSRSPVGFFHRL
jgi:hypothetical protein